MILCCLIERTRLSQRQRSPSDVIFLVHTCSSLDQSHSCGCVTIDTCTMERSLSVGIFLVHTRSSLDQSDGHKGITAPTCIMQGHLRLESSARQRVAINLGGWMLDTRLLQHKASSYNSISLSVAPLSFVPCYRTTGLNNSNVGNPAEEDDTQSP